MRIFKAPLFLILALCATLAGAQDTAVLPLGLGSSKPTFYDETQMVQLRGAAAQSPLNLEFPVDSGYVLGPGDFFEAVLPTGTEVAQVSPEGTVAFQGCGVVQVLGLRLADAKRKIKTLLKTRYDIKQVSVHLVQLRKFRVLVTGAVEGQGQISLDGQSRLSAAVNQSGRYLPVADRERVRVVRGSDTLVVDALAGQDPFLQAGDHVIVPFVDSKATILLRTVDGSQQFAFVPGRTIGEYLAKSNFGRIRDPGYQTVRLTRADSTFEWLDMKSALAVVPPENSTVNFLMQKNFVYVGGAVSAMGRAEYIAGNHAIDYIGASGVNLLTGGFDRASVVRSGEEMDIDPYKDEILPGDVILIPMGYYERTKDATVWIASLISIFATVVTIVQLTK